MQLQNVVDIVNSPHALITLEPPKKPDTDNPTTQVFDGFLFLGYNP